jgi:hypothetical protein
MPGVVSGMTFTMWWNGGMRTAPYFHNQIGILSEVGHASATPADHDPADFPATFGAGSGAIPTLEPTIHYPDPWRGGRASIGQAVQYHLVSSLGTLDVAQKNREDFLYNFYAMGRDAIRAGEAGDPFAYVISLEDQHDAGEAVEMLNTLRRGGIEVERATADFQAGGRTFPAGSYILPAAQAFRAHLLDMMEPQEHPHREIYPGGRPSRRTAASPATPYPFRWESNRPASTGPSRPRPSGWTRCRRRRRDSPAAVTWSSSPLARTAVSPGYTPPWARGHGSPERPRRSMPMGGAFPLGRW